MGTFDYSSNSSSNLDAFYRNFYPKCVKESSINMNHMTINENDVNNIWECRHGCKNDPYLLMQVLVFLTVVEPLSRSTW